MTTCLVFGDDLVFDFVAEVDLVRLREEIHRGIDALELAAGDGQIARLGRAAAEDDRVEIAAKVFDLHVLADVGVGDELDAFILPSA